MVRLSSFICCSVREKDFEGGDGEGFTARQDYFTHFELIQLVGGAKVGPGGLQYGPGGLQYHSARLLLLIQTPPKGVSSYWHLGGAGTFNNKVMAKNNMYSAVKIIQYESSGV